MNCRVRCIAQSQGNTSPAVVVPSTSLRLSKWLPFPDNKSHYVAFWVRWFHSSPHSFSLSASGGLSFSLLTYIYVYLCISRLTSNTFPRPRPYLYLQCLCSYNRQGLFCEKTVQIRRAAFAGDSYVSHRVNGKRQEAEQEEEEELDRKSGSRDDKDELERALPIDVVFRGRTRAAEGLIMLAIGQGTHGSHYMALFLQRGLLQFQFSCGLQTMLLSELEAPINTGHEMIIHAS